MRHDKFNNFHKGQGMRGSVFKILLKKPTGFTLVEILVAVMLLSIGILAVSQMTIMSQRSNQVIREYMEAREVLARGIEVLKIMPITDPNLDQTCGAWGLDSISLAYHADTNNVVGKTIGSMKDYYDVYWNVADNMPNTDQKTIRMIVLNHNGRFLMNADYVRWR